MCLICVDKRREEIERSILTILELEVVAKIYNLKLKLLKEHASCCMTEKWIAEVQKYPPPDIKVLEGFK
jgi:hypothetical protein